MSQEMRDRALKLAALAANNSNENEANSAARRLASLIDSNPHLLGANAPDSPEPEGASGEYDGFLDALEKRLVSIATKVDMRARCVACGKPAERLRYGKCFRCTVRVRK